MLRRVSLRLNIWARYRFSHAAVPKAEGPPPIAAPREMNRNKKFPLLDPINDPFPRSIRGNIARPDVPDHNYVQQWFFLNTTSPTGELFPWSATAPEGSFRFRPFGSPLNRLGRDTVEELRKSDALRLRDGSFRNPQRGSKHLPMREEYLTLMSSSSTKINYNFNQNNNNTNNNNTSKSAPSPTTVMDRARKERYQRVRHLSPLQQQMDVGRIEPVARVAANIPVDKARFPYKWKMTDWYEWEITKVRLQRFVYENAPSHGNNHAHPLFSSEVTYKVTLGMSWEHHIEPFAEDVCSFLREVGRQVVEEKLQSVRASLVSARMAPVDVDLRNCYDLSNNNKSENKNEINLAGNYSADEIRTHQQRELEQLEAECVHVLSLINASASGLTGNRDPSTSWPVIEDLDAWRRMVEFWSERGDTTFANAEASTRKYEFRRFFRVIKIKLPFQSTEFEKRMYDTRHWAHRGATLEFQTIHKKNLVHDASLFPIEHDSVEMPSHEHHRMFSFALDWQSAPANFLHTTDVAAPGGESVAEVAQRLGCSVESLRAANPALFLTLSTSSSSSSSTAAAAAAASAQKLEAGTSVNIPADATKRLTSTSVSAKKIALSVISESSSSSSSNTNSNNSWTSAASFLGCTVDELKAANGAALATYDDANDTFAAATESLNIPSSLLAPATIDAFSDLEPTFVNDTFESIAERLGCSVADLKAAQRASSSSEDGNDEKELDDPSKVTHVKVPASATRPRRRTHPLLRPSEAAHELFPKMTGELAAAAAGGGGIPSHIPFEPENASENFPGEFSDGAGAYPQNPRLLPATDDWLAYTARYLDPDLSLKAEVPPAYNVNRVWPAQAVPGSVQQEPFSEDQTWMLHRIPLHTHEVAHPVADSTQGLPETNNEQYAQSLDWRAP